MLLDLQLLLGDYGKKGGAPEMQPMDEESSLSRQWYTPFVSLPPCVQNRQGWTLPWSCCIVEEG